MTKQFSYPEIDRIYKALSKLKDEITPKLNRRDRAEVMIGACITLGFDTRHLIVKWLRVAGLSPKHVVRVLDERTGPVPGAHLWQINDDKGYVMLDVNHSPYGNSGSEQSA